jgi:protein-S-isoprenylcysteine O-methyltransferase Ste14
MDEKIAEVIWMLGVVTWFVVRYPFARRANRIPKILRRHRMREGVLLAISAAGLGIIPIIYVIVDIPSEADYSFTSLQGWVGLLAFAGSLVLFRRTHKAVGQNWSVTLEVREKHALITHGPYRRVRHPMYAAFWLWAAAQALLLPNWIAGFSGIVGFGILFFLRIGHEEQLMLETFGDQYENYKKKTWRILPGIY